MSKSSPKKYVFDYTVPYIAFKVSEFSVKATIIGHVFNQGLNQINDFLYFIRILYQVFEPSKGSIIKAFLEQINEENINYDFNWNEHFQTLFSWEEQEEIISELVFTKIVDRYITYLTDMASYVIDKNQCSLDKKALLRNFPNIKKCYREHFNTPLYLTPEAETLADQLITIRNIIVHGLNYIPDPYYPRFQNWEELGCIKQDEDILFVKFDIRDLERFGLFFTKSVADIDTRLSKDHHLDRYYFHEEDIPEEHESYSETIDEEFSTEE